MIKKLKNFLLVILFLGLTSCGFKPTLSKNADGYTTLDEVRLGEVNGEDQPRLYRIISKQFVNSPVANYQVDINVHEDIDSMGILKDGQSTRYKVRVNFDYKIIDIHTQDKIDAGNILLSNSFDVPQSEFASYISERSVYDNLLTELCKELQNRIILVLYSRSN